MSTGSSVFSLPTWSTSALYVHSEFSPISELAYMQMQRNSQLGLLIPAPSIAPTPQGKEILLSTLILSLIIAQTEAFLEWDVKYS